MNIKLYWGLVVLIVLLISVFIVMSTRTTDTEPDIVYIDVEPSKDNPPPAEPGYKWVWHHNRWDRVKEDMPSEQGNVTTLNTEEYGVTRQGKRYKKNPVWADRAEAHAIPTGPPLTINWHNWADVNTRNFQLDWYDPRTWEAYRNFWGFDRPHVNPDGTVPWRAVLDNWGTPLQNFRNVSLVVKYNKRIGFRPTPEQFAEHQALVARYEDAQALRDDLTAASLRSQITALEASARGELPDPNSYFSIGYGGDLDLKNLSDDELRRINREKEAVGISNLYKRLGIEHLYEYYEKPRF